VRAPSSTLDTTWEVLEAAAEELDPLDALSGLAARRVQLVREVDELDAARWDQVLAARDQGLSWHVIAQAAGVTRQALMKRARAEGLR
jgi:hypothetical protein